MRFHVAYSGRTVAAFQSRRRCDIFLFRAPRDNL
jgi:hypothetical protein